MKVRNVVLLLILAMSCTIFLPDIHAEPSVSIIMEKTTYSYCEKLFYTIKVSEITGDSAIMHITDEAGKSSSAIPIPITSLQNPIPFPFAFEKEIFPLGKYFIDIQYSGSEVTTEFDLIDSNKICFPGIMKEFLLSWHEERISDGFLIDAFDKYIDKEIMDIPFKINEDTIYGIDIPDWVRNIGYWWIQGEISDQEFIQIVNYLIDNKIISSALETENEV